MPTAQRAIDQGTRLAERHAAAAADEIRERRLMLGQSQELVARSCRMSRGRFARIERGRATNLTILELDRIAAVLGLAASIRLYPGGPPVRDAAHAARLTKLLTHVRPPLSYRIEVPLPKAGDRWDGRAWDVVLSGGGRRTSVELEMRLRDVQAMWRRLDLKRRDDPTDDVLLLVADTRANRRVIAEFAVLFKELPKLRPSAVRAAVQAGRHPGTGFLLI